MSNPEDEELDKSHAALTQATRKRQRNSGIVVALVTVAAIMVSASTVLSAWSLSELRETTVELRKLQKAAIEDRRIIRLGTECVVEQFSEHRVLTASGHRADAAHHGYTYPIPAENEPPVVPGVLEHVCKEFLQTTTTSAGRK